MLTIVSPEPAPPVTVDVKLPRVYASVLVEVGERTSVLVEVGERTSVLVEVGERTSVDVFPGLN